MAACLISIYTTAISVSPVYRFTDGSQHGSSLWRKYTLSSLLFTNLTEHCSHSQYVLIILNSKVGIVLVYIMFKKGRKETTQLTLGCS